MANPFDEFDTQVNPFDEFDEGEPTPEENTLLKQIGGGAETLYGMTQGAIGQVGGGLYGLSTLASGQGLDKAVANQRMVEEALAYKPYSKRGAEYTEKLGEVMAIPGEKARELTTPYLGELGGTHAQIAVDSILNLVEPTAIFKGGKAALTPKKEVLKAPPGPTMDERIQELNRAQEPKLTEGQGELFGEAPQGPVRAPNPFDEFDAPTSPDGRQMDLVDEVQRAERIDAAQAALEERQTQLEFAVKRQAVPELEAAERARQLEQPLPPIEEAAANTPELALVPKEESVTPDVLKSEMKFTDFQEGNRTQVLDAMKTGDAASLKVAVDDVLSRIKTLSETVKGKDQVAAKEYLEKATNSYRSLLEGAKHTEANNALNSILAQGPTNLRTALEAVYPNLPRELQVIAAALARMSPDTTVGHASDGAFRQGVLGESDSMQNSILLNRDAPMQSAVTLLHEGVHAATVRAVVTDNHLRAATEVMMEDLLAADPSLAHEYGFTDIKEFLAESMTNRGLQERLKTMPASAAAEFALKGKTMWNKFMDLIRQALGLPATKEVMNALDQAMKLGSTVMMEQYQGAGSPAHMRAYEATVLGNPSQTNLPKSAMELIPPQRPDTVETPISPATIAEKAKLRQAADAMPIKSPQLDRFGGFTTPQEALAAAEKSGWKDNAPSKFGIHAGSGAQFHSVMTNNPLIKYMNTMQRQIRSEVNAFVREHLSGPDGLSRGWQKLSGPEKVEVVEALKAGDKNQTQITPETGKALGLSDSQMNYIAAFYKADDASFKRWQETRKELGLPEVPYRPGHVPSVWTGAYRSVMTTADGVPFVIAVDSTRQLAAAKQYLMEKYPDAKFADQDRRGLSGSGRQANIFSGVNDVIQILAQNDPRFAEVAAVVDGAIKKSGNELFGFNVHEKDKIGAGGALGDKPWLQPEKNANEFHAGMVSYFEQAAQHHAMQVPLHDMKQIMTDPNVPMPKTKKYMDEYVRNMEGKISKFGEAVNTIIDTPGALVGVGPQTVLNTTNNVKNQMSRLFMGWFNYVFTLQQIAQLGQTGVPMLNQLAGELGNAQYAPVAGVKGMTSFMSGILNDMSGKDLPMSPTMKAAYGYAKEHGMLNFSEMEHDYQTPKGKVGRTIDAAADINMMLGEKATRTPMFMSFVELFTNAGMPLKEALAKAENATYLSMFDYHAFERPLAYAKLGVMGKFAGALTTYKHGYLGNQVELVKEARKNPAGIASSALALIALTGLTGVPFYDELDELYGQITDKFFGKRENIRNAVMPNLPEWTKTGALSSALDINAYSKFSAANMVPDADKPGAALSPQLAGAYKILADGYDLAKNQDRRAVGNLLYDLAPNGPAKGMIEDKFFRGPKGELLDREGNVKYRRDETEWMKRKFSGLKSLKEARSSESEFTGMQRDKADQERLKALGEKSMRKFKGGSLTPDEINAIVKEYTERGGDPAQVLPNEQKIGKMVEGQTMTPEEIRLKNLKDNPSLANMRKWMNYEAQR